MDQQMGHDCLHRSCQEVDRLRMRRPMGNPARFSEPEYLDHFSREILIRIWMKQPRQAPRHIQHHLYFPLLYIRQQFSGGHLQYVQLELL